MNKKLADLDYTERHRQKHLIEIIEEKYQEALKSNKITKQTGEFKQLTDHGLIVMAVAMLICLNRNSLLVLRKGYEVNGSDHENPRAEGTRDTC